jgi:lipoprotein signal peptidase
MLLCYGFSFSLTEATYHWFFKVQSLAMVIPAIIILKFAYKTKARALSIGYLGLTISNFLDELFFDPTQAQWNEIVFGILIILWIVKDEKYGLEK